MDNSSRHSDTDGRRRARRHGNCTEPRAHIPRAAPLTGRTATTLRVAGVLHASRARPCANRLIARRPDGTAPVPGHREFADLALNILNVFVRPQKELGGDHEPVKCFRGQCAARELVARRHRRRAGGRCMAGVSGSQESTARRAARARCRFRGEASSECSRGRFRSCGR